VSSADPKATFLKLLGSEHLDAGFVRRVAQVRSRGLTAKLHLALERLPQFPGVAADSLRGRLLGGAVRRLHRARVQPCEV